MLRTHTVSFDTTIMGTNDVVSAFPPLSQGLGWALVTPRTYVLIPLLESLLELKEDGLESLSQSHFIITLI